MRSLILAALFVGTLLSPTLGASETVPGTEGEWILQVMYGPNDTPFYDIPNFETCNEIGMIMSKTPEFVYGVTCISKSYFLEKYPNAEVLPMERSVEDYNTRGRAYLKSIKSPEIVEPNEVI